MCIHIYIYIYTHIHIYIYIYIYRPPRRRSSLSTSPAGQVGCRCLVLGSILDVPKPKRNGLVKKVGPFSKRKNPL